VSLTLCAALVLTGAAAAAAQAPDRLAAARTLYAQAAYDEALAAMNDLHSLEANRYRALCLLALGRLQEAEQALEAIVHRSPAYLLPDADVPPRLLQLFADTRQRVLPAVIRRLFAHGRDRFQAAAFEDARTTFGQVLRLVEDPAVDGAAGVADLRLLASGYLDLIVHAEASRLTTPSPLTARLPPAPAPDLPPPPPLDDGPSMVVVPPVAVSQDIPTYVTAAGAGLPRLSGAVRVVIGRDGTVSAASIERSVHPRYDARLLGAARGWHYQPATRNGIPIPSEKIVEVQIGRD
jgi:TonB family protein